MATCGKPARRATLARNSAHISRVQSFAAVAAHKSGDGLVLAVGVHQIERRTVGGGVRIAPLAHGVEHRPQVATLGTQGVVVTYRVLAIGGSFQDTSIHETLEALLEHVSRDAQPALKRVESLHTEERVTHDQHRPPLADDFEALRHGTVHIAKTLSFHVFIIVSCIMIFTMLR